MPKIPKGVVLTEEQQQLVEEIKEARNATKKAGIYLGSIIQKCQHLFPAINPERDKDPWKEKLSYNAHCMICEGYFGHLCLKSPDKTCHYFSENGKVKLNNHTLVDIPDDHDSEYETEDECIFCGWPEERK